MMPTMATMFAGLASITLLVLAWAQPALAQQADSDLADDTATEQSAQHSSGDKNASQFGGPGSVGA